MEKLLETKENVMNWLNKQVDKQVVDKGGGAVGGKRGGRGGVNRLGVRTNKANASDPVANGTVAQVGLFIEMYFYP